MTTRRAARFSPARMMALGLAMQALAPAAAWSQASTSTRYALDPAQSWVEFEVMHFGTSTLRGRLGPVTGTVLLDTAAQTGHLGVTVATESVNTGVPVLDAILRGSQGFDSAAEPLATLVATQFEFDAQRQVKSVRGEFRLRGHSEGLTLTALHFACRLDRDKRRVCGGDFEGRLKRSDFGVTLGLPFVADEVRVVVQVEGVAEARLP